MKIDLTTAFHTRVWWRTSWWLRYPLTINLIEWKGNGFAASTTGYTIQLNIFKYIYRYLFRKHRLPHAKVHKVIV